MKGDCIGIDPGKSGAMAIIRENGKIETCLYDREEYIRLLKSARENSVCVIEHVGAMPGQGVTSMFTFGETFGFAQGALEALGIRYEMMRPAKWKKEFSLSKDKNKSVDVCKKLFPGTSLLPGPRHRKDHDGIAEAILMAEIARRRLL